RILAQRLNHFQFEHGTKLEFEMKFDSIPDNFNFSEDSLNVITLMKEFDPIVFSSFPILQAKLKDSIIKFAKGSHFTISLDGVNIENQNTRILKFNDNPKFFDSDMMIEIELKPRLNTRSINILYRGQPVKDHNHTQFYLFDITANLFDEKADYWLTIDRNSIRSSKNSELIDKITKAVENTLPKFLDFYTGKANNGTASIEDKEALGIFHLGIYLYYNSIYSNLNKSMFLDLRTDLNKHPTFREMSIEKNNCIRFEVYTDRHSPDDRKITYESKEGILAIDTREIFMTHYLRLYLHKEFDSHRIEKVSYDSDYRKRKITYIAENKGTRSHSISPSAFKYYCSEYIRIFSLSYSYSNARVWFSKFSEEYSLLEVE
ncbi:hypothetical protein, partial [Leptospira idonii]|uniref:hypothetical protein n=1 Tax=Leptospira idonii TaxID=1193500 RepID=UPI00143839B7